MHATRELRPQLLEVTQALLAARHTGSPAADASRLADQVQSAGDAYAIHDWLLQAIDGTAAVPGHWKSGGPSRDAPLTHAPLPVRGVMASPADAHALPLRQWRIEAEVALRLGAEVDAAQAALLTPESAASLIDDMAVSIELVDSRWAPASAATVWAKLADLSSHGALVLGEWHPFAPRDWLAQVCTVQIGQNTPARFTGTHSLGDPAWLLAGWLRHLTRHGARVPRGTVVTTGSWCGLLPASPGDRVQAAFEGIGQAVVQL
jgi:2-keto-4-pentenoate hydratase